MLPSRALTAAESPEPREHAEPRESRDPAPRPCAHCGLPTSASPDQPAESVFCCQGCRQAYELIHGWGLDQYYALRDRVGGEVGSVASPTAASFEAFDEAEFLGHSKPRPLADGSLATELSVSGLHCAACAWLIEAVAARTPGWSVARVKLNRHTLEVVFDPSRIKLSQIVRLVSRLGYGLSPLSDEPVDRFAQENRRLLTQIAVAGFFAANAMWIAIALYAGDASGVAAEHRWFLRVAGAVLGAATVALPGRTFFVGAWASLQTRTPHMDLPVALGLSVGTVVGTVNAITNRGEVYFDSLAMLVFLLLIGRWIQFRQQHRAANAVDLLLRITPQHARLIDPEEPQRPARWVMVRTLAPGQRIRVHVGESLPVDGRVVAGDSTVDRSLLTGESVPVAVTAGDEVTAGTVNLSRPLEVEVTATGSQSRIGKVMQSVEAAMARRTPIVRLADSVGGVFVVVVTILAAIAFLIWLPHGIDLATAHATSLLIVACPCALALATPLAIAVSLGRAAKRKILIRDGDVLQQLSRGGTAWFDKTGTLTEGRPRAELVHGSPPAVALAAGLEARCCHPIADAIVKLADLLQVPRPESAEQVELSNGGVFGRCGGHQIVVGNETLMRRQGVLLAREARQAAEAVVRQHRSPILIGIDGQAAAVLAISDPLKRDARATVVKLRQLGWQVGILSGDHDAVVRQVSCQLDIASQASLGGLSPEEKLARVTAPGQGTVMMVGDGANDAAALAAAQVGVAVRGGAEVSLQAAPVFVASGVLESLVQLVTAARRTTALIWTTFAVSLAYNVVAVALALGGLISPLVAAILMPISSVSVLSLTLLWPTFREPPR